MHEEIQRLVHHWSIVLRSQRDTALPWRAVAFGPDNSGASADGFSREDALRTVANKVGLDPQLTLAEFGL